MHTFGLLLGPVDLLPVGLTHHLSFAKCRKSVACDIMETLSQLSAPRRETSPYQQHLASVPIVWPVPDRLECALSQFPLSIPDLNLAA